jgi:hypothetical protein
MTAVIERAGSASCTGERGRSTTAPLTIPEGKPSGSSDLGLASMVVAGFLSLMVTWWSSPLDPGRPA